MTSYPNQKTVLVHRDMPKQTKENKRSYVIAYTDVISQASNNLGTKHTAFKLYLYLLCNQDNYLSALSPQDFANEYGVSVKAAKDAVNDLIETGYLVLKDKKFYDFYETPRDNDIKPQEEVKKQFQSKGEILELTYAELEARVGKERAKELWEVTK